MSGLYATDNPATAPSSPLSRVSRVAALVTMGMGIAVLAIWIFGIAAVQALLPGGLLMASITALTFLLAGASLWIATSPRASHLQGVGTFLAWTVVAIALARLLTLALGVDFPLHRLLEPGPGATKLAHATMAPFTASAFVLVGVALALLRSRSHRWVALAQVLALAAMSVAFLTLVGYVYGVKAWNQTLAFFPMAVHTSLTHLVVAVGILLARTDVGVPALWMDRGAAGALLRRLTPAFLIAPVALGWLGLTGERQGLFDRPFGIAVMVAATVVIALGLLWRNARLTQAVEHESRRAQELLAKQNEELRRLAEGLQQANARLIEADRHKDEFLSVVSHELRTPLNFIMGFASLLDDGVVGDLTPSQQRYVEKILQGSDRMLGLVDDLLDAARISAGRVEIARAPAAYADILHAVVDTLSPLAAEKRIRLEGTANTHAPVMLDARRITQVLTNLVANAIKFTPEGGSVTIRAYDWGNCLLTEVTDTGIGISKEDLPKLFQRFYQVDMGSTREVGGSGLGLAIAQALIEAHDGRIEVESALGVGTTFRFMLPLMPVTTGQATREVG